jgi:hypothetical protein
MPPTSHRPALLEALALGNITAKDVNTAVAHMLYELTREQEQEKETYHNPLK